MNLKTSHLWRMINHDLHELSWQKVEIAAHHLFLISFFSMLNLIFTYSFQLCHFDVCALINISLFLRENVSILKNSCDSFLLWVVKKNSCRSTIFNQTYVISDRLLVQIWKDLVIKISAEEKIKYQIIKYTDQKLLMLQSINL